MADFSHILATRPDFDDDDREWLHHLVADWQVIADLSFSDLVLWVEHEGGFVSVAHCRPTTGTTVHQDDVVGQSLPASRVDLMVSAMSSGIIQHSQEPRWTGSYAVREDLVPVVCNGRTIAVLSRESNIGIARAQVFDQRHGARVPTPPRRRRRM